MPFGRSASRVTRTLYKGKLTAWANINGAASLARGELLLSLSQYEPIDLADFPVLLADDGHSAEKIHSRTEERRKAKRTNIVRLERMTKAMRDLKISLAAKLYQAMQVNAGTLIDEWRTKFLLEGDAEDPNVDLAITDGVEIYKALIKFLEMPDRSSDLRVHERGIEAYQEVGARLGDNCTCDQYAQRIDSFKNEHNKYLGARAYKGERLSQFYIGQLPKNLDAAKVAFVISLNAGIEGQGWEDTNFVYDRCFEMVAQIHRPTEAIPTLALVSAAGELILPVAPGGGGGGKRDRDTREKKGDYRGDGRGRARGGAGRPGGRGGTRIVPFPPGQLCKQKTCNLDHGDMECYRHPGCRGPMKVRVPETCLKIMEAREDNSKKLGIPCVEMRDSEGKVITIQGLRALIEKKNHPKPVTQALPTSRVWEGIDEDEDNEERTGIYNKNKIYTLTPNSPFGFSYPALASREADETSKQLKIEEKLYIDRANQTDGESEDDNQPDEPRVVKFYVIANGLCILGDQESGRRDVIIATKHVETDVDPFTRHVAGAKQRAYENLDDARNHLADLLDERAEKQDEVRATRILSLTARDAQARLAENTRRTNIKWRPRQQYCLWWAIEAQDPDEDGSVQTDFACTVLPILNKGRASATAYLTINAAKAHVRKLQGTYYSETEDEPPALAPVAAVTHITKQPELADTDSDSDATAADWAAPRAESEPTKVSGEAIEPTHQLSKVSGEAIEPTRGHHVDRPFNTAAFSALIFAVLLAAPLAAAQMGVEGPQNWVGGAFTFYSGAGVYFLSDALPVWQKIGRAICAGISLEGIARSLYAMRRWDGWTHHARSVILCIITIIVLSLTGVGGSASVKKKTITNIEISDALIPVFKVVLNQTADKHYFRYCDEAFCYENKFLSQDEIAKISAEIGLPFVGISDKEGFFARLLEIIDSGAYRGVRRNKDGMVPGSLQRCSISLSGVGGIVVANEMADFYVYFKLEGGGRRRVILREQLIVPSCPHNLVSIGTEAMRGVIGLRVETTGEAFITFPDGKISRLLNLGVLVVPDKTMPTYTVQAQQHELAVNLYGIHESRVSYGGYKRALDVSGPVLHDRFNHTATARLQNIAKTSADAPLSWGHRIASNESKACDACLRAKATRLHSQREMPKTYKPGDNVSFDIFTSEVPHRAGGQKYVIGFTDSFSSRKKLYLLHNKSDAPEALDMYINWCKSKGVTVIRLHTDNAPEFGEHSEPMQRVLKAHNLYGAMTTCAPYTPNQNGSAERMWRTMLEPTRAQLVRANLPASFWWYAMCNASEIDAVLPLRGAPDETPHSRFEGGKPNITHIRVFGCRAYPTTLDPKFKFGEKAPRGIYLGRSTTQPAYIVYIPEINKIVTTPNVVFIETIFPGIGRGITQNPIPGQPGGADALPEPAAREIFAGGGGGFMLPPLLLMLLMPRLPLLLLLLPHWRLRLRLLLLPRPLLRCLRMLLLLLLIRRSPRRRAATTASRSRHDHLPLNIRSSRRLSPSSRSAEGWTRASPP